MRASSTTPKFDRWARGAPISAQAIEEARAVVRALRARATDPDITMPDQSVLRLGAQTDVCDMADEFRIASH